MWLELGGKTASVILPDADVEHAARTTAWGAFFNQGEMCSASSRMIVHRDVADMAISVAVEQARAMQPGDPYDRDCTLGALVGEEHLQNVIAYVERALADGARIVAGEPERSAAAGMNGLAGKGSYFAPVVLADVRPEMEIAQREVFGPVLSVIQVNDVDEAISAANDTRYGLAAALWTRDISSGHRLSRKLRAGTVWVNCFEEGDMTIPFGGVKGSGYGRDKSAHALDKFSDLKSTWIDLS